ncbi:helicase HerA domain-containing protein [Gimesia sp.]|uniref:helicase HerA domain-containing protein n=1 Tax=Gimesia sp. TaxID=2024833 RepID=UPI003A8D12C3
MQLTEMLQKLYPLMPDQVERWRRSFLMGSPEIKRMLEQQIRFQAQKILSGAPAGVLLSLPPEDIARGEISLGNILYDKVRWPLGLRKKELTQHTVICGRSGSGKTNCVAQIMKQLTIQRVPMLMFDWKQTARHFLSYLNAPFDVWTAGRTLNALPLNPFVVPKG